jgi:hypothetical protein
MGVVGRAFEVLALQSLDRGGPEEPFLGEVHG